MYDLKFNFCNNLFKNKYLICQYLKSKINLLLFLYQKYITICLHKKNNKYLTVMTDVTNYSYKIEIFQLQLGS